MARIALVGDSIFDNAPYVDGGPDVSTQVRGMLPAGWTCDLHAVDGALTNDVPGQVARISRAATHIVLSIGGNDALHNADVLEMETRTSAQAFLELSAVATRFEGWYQRALDACLARGLPVTICTIYNGSFPEADFQKIAIIALTSFNDVIIRAGIRHGLRVIDLRSVCNRPEHYANPIEPSVAGGERIAAAIVKAVTGAAHGGDGAHVLG